LNQQQLTKRDQRKKNHKARFTRFRSYTDWFFHYLWGRIQYPSKIYSW